MSLVGIAWSLEKVKGGFPGEFLAIELMVVLLVVVSYKSKTWELKTIRALVQVAGVKGTGQISRGLTRGQILPLGR